MRPPIKSPRFSSPAERFRAEIEKAVGEGVACEDMTLRLTLRDASHLKRDPRVAVSEISFADGSMRFLGVCIREGGVAQSELVRP
jgi:hypothetical protein